MGDMRMIQKILIVFFLILVINGSALAADRNVIIGFHQSVNPAEVKIIHDNGGKVKRTFHLVTAVSANMSDENITKMKKDPRVAYVVNDSIYQAVDEYTSSWGVQYIDSQPVHNENINGTGVKIAVLDTGIDSNHEDLKDNFKGGYDFVYNDPDPWDDNCLSYFKTCHGTHVSGTIAAEKNGIGVVGVAPGASIYSVKVLDGGGFGYASLLISGIEWAVANNMNIISMSLESTENNTAVFNAVNAAYNSGVLLVAAAGNTNGGAVRYPAAYDSVIAVTAIDQNGQRASFSPIDQKIEVAAPGVNINSTVCITADFSHCLQGGYGFLSGTSMAAPHVTGVAALIFSTLFADVNGDGLRNNKDVREIIRNTAFDAGIPGKDNVYGYGIVNASKALHGTSAIPPATTSFAPDSPVNDNAGISRTFNITIDQVVNVTWYINGNSIQSNVSVTDARYTNISGSSGIWNVTAMASNVNGSLTRSWTWNVTSIYPSVSNINVIVKSGGVNVSEANVWITSNDIQKTDSNGNYKFIVPEGTYNVTVSKQPTYLDNTVTGIIVTPSNTTTVNVEQVKKQTGTITGRVTNV